jgi:hypothetical protein
VPNKRSFCNLRPSKSLYYGTLFILLLTSSSCNSLIRGKLFKDRATETPPPSEERIEKSFFVDPSGKPKTFLCAWAPEMGRGWVGEYVTLMVNNSPHCNIEFEVTERLFSRKDCSSELSRRQEPLARSTQNSHRKTLLLRKKQGLLRSGNQ